MRQPTRDLEVSFTSLSELAIYWHKGELRLYPRHGPPDDATALTELELADLYGGVLDAYRRHQQGGDDIGHFQGAVAHADIWTLLSNAFVPAEPRRRESQQPLVGHSASDGAELANARLIQAV